jgi:hypothetical protein
MLRMPNALMAGYRKSGIGHTQHRQPPQQRATGIEHQRFGYGDSTQRFTKIGVSKPKTTGSALIYSHTVGRIPTARFAVPRHEGGRCVIHRGYKKNRYL